MTAANPPRIDTARSFLFVPGNRPDRFDKALASGADAVVLDLEDAVPPAEKAAARTAIGSAWQRLRGASIPLVVRINPAGGPLAAADLRCAAELEGLAGVMTPKVESVTELARVRSTLPNAGLLPLIESAAGYTALTALAGAGGVVRFVLGHLDFMADTGLVCSTDQPELAPLRFAIAMATRCGNLAPPIDGVTTNFRDDELLRADTRRALRFGFGAKLCIHPRQVPVVHETLAPGPAETAWARRVLAADAAAQGGAVQLDGKMIDAPVVLQARRVLARVAEGRSH